MTNRRVFLGGLLASTTLPATGWAKAGSPAYLSAAQRHSGAYILCGLSTQGRLRFEIPLPGRGHAAAAHPTAAQAVAFARRPGQFALVIDCTNGTSIAELSAPAGRHFYGHGAFSADGALLFTTENDYDTASGVIGVWDVKSGYSRLTEFSSGGIGPHDIQLMPDHTTLAVANGGIETHPDTGRAKLNIPDMAPNLSYLSLTGKIRDQITLGSQWSRDSIRHLAVSGTGLTALGMQWQGDAQTQTPLLAVHRRGTAPRFMMFPKNLSARMDGYVGSVALSADGKTLTATSPRGNLALRFDVATGTLRRQLSLPDACGVAGPLITTGTGDIIHIDTGQITQHPTLRWDNHLIRIPG